MFEAIFYCFIYTVSHQLKISLYEIIHLNPYSLENVTYK